MNKAFIFTMDAVLALIPIFIVIASISQISIGGSLFLQTHVLGGERIAQDVLRIMEIRGDIRSDNQTELNETLETIIPSYLNYSYVVEYADTGAVYFTLGRGNITNATEIMTAKRIVTFGTYPRSTLVCPNALTKTIIEPGETDESYALNAVFYALLGILNSVVEDANFTTDSEWSEIGEVTIKLGNFSDAWGTNNKTIGFLVDRLIEEASSEGKSTAVDGLNKFKARLDQYDKGDLNYTVSEILDPYPVNTSLVDMDLSAVDALYAAAQSANRIEPGVGTTNMTSDDGNYRLVISIDVSQTTNISARSEGDVLFYSGITNVTIEVWNNVTYLGNWTLLDTLELEVSQNPCFNVTNIEIDTENPGTTLVDIDSLDICDNSFTVTATNYTADGEISSIGSITASQNSTTLGPNAYIGAPMVEEGVIFSGANITLYDIYNESITNAGDDLTGVPAGVLNMFPLTFPKSTNTTQVKMGYVTVESVLYEVEQYRVTLSVWST